MSRVQETALSEVHARYLEWNRMLGALHERFDYYIIIIVSVSPPKSSEAHTLAAVGSKYGKRTYTPLKFFMLMP